MMQRISTAAAALILMLATGIGEARRADPQPADSDALKPVLSCRTITTDRDRLACFDKAANALDEAATRRDIVVVDSKAVAQARRSLFGFATPALEIFKPRADQPEPSEVSGTVRAARRDGDGYWIVTLDDGAVWHQTGGLIGGTVRAGDAVVVKRASLGSYFIRVGGRPGVRARREG